eukprot:gene31254-6399_t
MKSRQDTQIDGQCAEFANRIRPIIIAGVRSGVPTGAKATTRAAASGAKCAAHREEFSVEIAHAAHTRANP